MRARSYNRLGRPICARCNKPLPRHLRADAVFCSVSCRAKEFRSVPYIKRRAAAAERSCEICAGPIAGRAIYKRTDAKTCSAKCRQRLYRRRQAPGCLLPKVLADELREVAKLLREDVAASGARPALAAVETRDRSRGLHRDPR